MADVFLNLAVALGLGLLVGLQRQRDASPIAGIRTFALVALLGGVCTVVGEIVGGWLLGVGLAAVAAVAVVGNVLRAGTAAHDPGLTTEVAMLVMFLVGSLAGAGNRELAVVLGAVTALLLHLRTQLHGFASRLGDQDMRGIMQFVVITLVVLPILPDQTYGPFDVLNPRKMWLMVVLITGLSLGGYVIYKLLGPRVGALAGGVLGGLISSTATTVTYARRTREDPAPGAALGTVVIMLASSVVFARVLVLVATAARPAFAEVAPPLALMLALTAGLSVTVWLRHRGARHDPPPAGNPTEIKTALVFAALFGGVLLAVAAAKHHFGDRGLFVVALLSGLTDMDAITLSTAQLVNAGQLEGRTGGRVILAAALANLVFKGLLIAMLGSRALLRQMGVLIGLALLGGVLVLVLW